MDRVKRAERMCRHELLGGLQYVVRDLNQGPELTISGESFQEVRDASRIKGAVGHATTHLDICRAHGTFFDRHELIAVNTAFESERLSADARRRSLASIIKKSRPSRSNYR